jgi:hypothetical protein
MPDKPTTVTLPPGWLREDTLRAAARVAQWPQWYRAAAAAYLADLGQPDPCPCRACCDEAQTCQRRCRGPRPL